MLPRCVRSSCMIPSYCVCSCLLLLYVCSHCTLSLDVCSCSMRLLYAPTNVCSRCMLPLDVCSRYTYVPAVCSRCMLLLYVCSSCMLPLHAPAVCSPCMLLLYTPAVCMLPLYVCYHCSYAPAVCSLYMNAPAVCSCCIRTPAVGILLLYACSHCMLPLHAPAICMLPLYAPGRQDEQHVPVTILVAQGKEARKTVQPGRQRKHPGPLGVTSFTQALEAAVGSTAHQLHSTQASGLHFGKKGVAHSSRDPQKMPLENPETLPIVGSQGRACRPTQPGHSPAHRAATAAAFLTSH